MDRIIYIICVCFIAIIFFINLNEVTSNDLFRNLYNNGYSFPRVNSFRTGVAYSLYFHNMFPVYLISVFDYCNTHLDFMLPTSDSPFHHEKARAYAAEYWKKNFKIWPAYSDLGVIFLIYIASLLNGQFFPLGVVMLNNLVLLAVMLYFTHALYRYKMATVGLLVAALIVSNSIYIGHLYYYALTGWTYTLLAYLTIFSIFIPIIQNSPMSEKKLLFKIALSTIAFFVFMTIRSSVIFAALPILFFVFIYGNSRLGKRMARVVLTLLLLTAPYFCYTGVVSSLRNYYHSKYQMPATAENYNGAHHIMWHGIYCGLGDFGEDRGFKWLDENAIKYAESVRPGIIPCDPEYEIILRRRVISFILENPRWYAKVLWLRAKRTFWDFEYSIFPYWKAKRYLWIHWLFLSSLAFFIGACVFRRKYTELKMYLFFIPSLITPLFITTAAGIRYYFGILVIYYMPLAFLVHFVFQYAAGGIGRLRRRYGS